MFWRERDGGRMRVVGRGRNLHTERITGRGERGDETFGSSKRE